MPWTKAHEGSEADCAEVVQRMRKHFPNKTWRLVTREEGAAERRRKHWSVHDADHIPDGSEVMLMVNPVELHPQMAQLVEMASEAAVGLRERRGVVKSRDRRTGRYRVDIADSRWSVSVDRADLIYPVPDNLIPLQRKR